MIAVTKSTVSLRRPTKPKFQPQTIFPVTLQPDLSRESGNGKLTLKVCCGNLCEEFQRPEDMFGIGCCGGQPINEFEEICCEGVTRRRRQPSSYVEGCCGNQTLSYDQTCCQGVVHNVPNGECCGTQAYPRNNLNVLCCNEVLNVNVEPGLTCCGTIPYDGGIRETCCGDAVFLKELFDGCCPLYGTDPPEYRQFNTRSHQCCDKPIERYSNTKCCYLTNSANVRERWRPKSYDSSTSCCIFPFNAIVPKNSKGTCVRVTAPSKTLLMSSITSLADVNQTENQPPPITENKPQPGTGNQISSSTGKQPSRRPNNQLLSSNNHQNKNNPCHKSSHDKITGNGEEQKDNNGENNSHEDDEDFKNEQT